MKEDIVIVGAGLSGAVAARACAEKGRKVLIVERLGHLAGHCYDYRNDAGITVHTYGPHIFHTLDRDIWRYVHRFANFRPYQHRVMSYVEGRLVPFPINLDTINILFGKHLERGDLDTFLKKEVAGSSYSPGADNFRDAVVSQVGEQLYSLFFEKYTIKQWNRDPRELSADIARRIPVRDNRDTRYFSDPYQGIPVGGYTTMVKNMLDHPSISLLLGTDYFDIQDELDPVLTVYTGELDRFFNYEYGKLEYRSLELEFETHDTERYQEAAVINYPNDYDWTRITEFKYFLGESSEKTTICKEYPRDTGEPYYVVLSKDNIERRTAYMNRVEALEKDRTHLFIGRLAEYTYYNMDAVIKRSLEKTGAFFSS